MTDSAIRDCMHVLESAIIGWLGESAQWGIGTRLPLPRIEAFPSAAGTTKRYIGGAAQWAGPLVVRVTAQTREAAYELLTQATAALPSSAVVDGYTITLQSIRPLMGQANGATVGMVYQASVKPGG